MLADAADGLRGICALHGCDHWLAYMCEAGHAMHGQAREAQEEIGGGAAGLHQQARPHNDPIAASVLHGLYHCRFSGFFAGDVAAFGVAPCAECRDLHHAGHMLFGAGFKQCLRCGHMHLIETLIAALNQNAHRIDHNIGPANDGCELIAVQRIAKIHLHIAPTAPCCGHAVPMAAQLLRNCAAQHARTAEDDDFHDLLLLVFETGNSQWPSTHALLRFSARRAAIHVISGMAMREAA